MCMNVRSLIEALAQFDGELEVRTRNNEVYFVTHPILDHAVELDMVSDAYCDQPRQMVVIG